MFQYEHVSLASKAGCYGASIGAALSRNRLACAAIYLVYLIALHVERQCQNNIETIELSASDEFRK